jgi:hypothetical protein
MSSTPILPTLATIHRLLKNTKLRLIQEYGWNEEFVNQAVNEYIRFLELHVAHPDVTIVPGKVVDKVWHDHILHTRDYIKFCEESFGSYFHHDPKDRSSDKVMDLKPTCELYLARYGHSVPKDYWLAEVVVRLPPSTPSPANATSHTNATTHTIATPTTYNYSGGCCRCGS